MSASSKKQMNKRTFFEGSGPYMGYSVGKEKKLIVSASILIYCIYTKTSIKW